MFGICLPNYYICNRNEKKIKQVNINLTIFKEMNKKLFFLAIAALGLAACSNDDVVEINQGEAISFRSFTTNVTRAADEHFNLANDKFGVTAFHKDATTSPYFDNITFATATNGGSYTSQSDKYYWPSGYNLDFYAYAPLASEVNNNSDETYGAVVTRNAYNEFAIRPGKYIANQPDFVYAVTKNWGKYKDGETWIAPEGHRIGGGATGVTINFRHAESKVAFKLANSNNNLKITVGDVTIGNLRGSETFTWNGVTDGTTPTAAADANTDGQYTSGTLTYLNGTWTATSAQTSAYTVTMESAASYNVFDGTVAAKNLYSSNPATNYDMILIPQALNVATTYHDGTSGSPFEGAYITVQIKVQNAATSDYILGDAGAYVTAMWPLTALTWLPGHKYTYTVDLASGGYNPTNVEGTDNKLDPVLTASEIVFVTVTVDNWADGAETSVYTGGL